MPPIWLACSAPIRIPVETLDAMSWRDLRRSPSNPSTRQRQPSPHINKDYQQTVIGIAVSAFTICPCVIMAE